MNIAVEKAWGFASNTGRHVKEGRTLLRAEAEYVVHVATATVEYILRTASEK